MDREIENQIFRQVVEKLKVVPDNLTVGEHFRNVLKQHYKI